MILELKHYGIRLSESSVYDVIRTGLPVAFDQNGTPTIIFQGWELVRDIRDAYLVLCDWTQIPDSPLTIENKAAWQSYRQSLRDLPQIFAEPTDVVFPKPPEVLYG